jgi:NifU-like protein
MLSSLATDHVQRPRNIGPLEPPCQYGVSGVPGEGPFVELWVRVEGDQILSAAYKTLSCPSSIACASLACDLVRGRTVEVASRITSEDLKTILGGLPDGKGHMADHTIKALKNALQENN